MTTSDDNLAIVRRWYDALAARDADTVRDLFAEDGEVWQTPELPWGGSYQGHDGLLTFFLTLVGTITSAVTEEGLFAAGDHVVQRGRTAGTVNANGAEFDVPEVHVFELRDGKVVKFTAYIDTPLMLAALNA
jgi:ketosteroid isomerase-like protein